MAALKITKWNHAGFQKILTSPEVMSEVEKITEKIKAQANANNTRGGKGFQSITKIDESYKTQRAVGLVYTTDLQSQIAEAEDKALSSAVSR